MPGAARTGVEYLVFRRQKEIPVEVHDLILSRSVRGRVDAAVHGIGSNARESLVSEGRGSAARGEMLGVPRRVDEDERPDSGHARGSTEGRQARTRVGARKTRRKPSVSKNHGT